MKMYVLFHFQTTANDINIHNTANITSKENVISEAYLRAA